MRCKMCGKEFTALSVGQKYCSEECGWRYRRRHDMDQEYPSISFQCAKCGLLVVTEGGVKDKRTRFCSAACEKKYWRHPPYEHKSSNITFQSLSKLRAWEQMTNG